MKNHKVNSGKRTISAVVQMIKTIVLGNYILSLQEGFAVMRRSPANWFHREVLNCAASHANAGGTGK